MIVALSWELLAPLFSVSGSLTSLRPAKSALGAFCNNRDVVLKPEAIFFPFLLEFVIGLKEKESHKYIEEKRTACSAITWPSVPSMVTMSVIYE